MISRAYFTAAAVTLGVLGSAGALAADAAADAASNKLAREVFKQLIEINTTDSIGNVTTASEAMATRASRPRTW
jgi:hypothetical protein